jgi:hypothetical protein
MEPAGWLTRAFMRKAVHHAEATPQTLISIVFEQAIQPVCAKSRS